MSTIPASLFVNVVPSVLPAGGAALDVTAVVMTESNRVPIGSVYSFGSPTAVKAFFGPASQEGVVAGGGTNLGGGYFAGFTNSDALPGSILFAQYNPSAVAAYLWGGNAFAALTLAQLQALSGSLTVVVDGYPHVISSISLAAYTSFSAVAAALQAAFTDPTESSFTASIGAVATGTGAGTNLTTSAVTGLISVGDSVSGTGVPANTTILSQTSGTPGGAGVYVTNNATTSSGASLTFSSNVLDVTVDSDHAIAAGQTLTGAGVAAGTLITAQLNGTPGGVGLYSISGAPQHVASEAMTGVATAPLVTFDPISGAFVVTSGVTGAPSTAAFATGTLAASLLLTQATGAVLSQGAAASTPSVAMERVVAATTNWVTYLNATDPDHTPGNTVKQAFAAWKNAYPNRYAYVCFDVDVLARSSPPQATTLGSILNANNDSGTFLISELTDLNQGAFVAGAAASIDFTEVNGRITFAFKTQAGLVSDVTSGQTAINLGGNPQTPGDFGNGYNYYGAVGSAAASFLWLQRGTVTGDFTWFDSYINQIVMNNTFQGALLNLQANAKSIPYTTSGDNLIETALADPIAQFLAFGAYAPGTITNAQKVAVNNAAGADVANTLQTQGYYLQVLPASGVARASRTTPPAKFWYLDRGSVQAITLDSIALQ